MSNKIEAVLEAQGVEFANSGRFEILVRCPQCGASDPSQHLAISLRGRGYRCLRNPRQHRGRAYSRLLASLLNCSLERAKELLGERGEVSLPGEDEFSQSWRKQLGLEPPQSSRPVKLSFPKEFRKLTPSAPRTARGFWDYLYGRGFTKAQAGWAVNNYELHYALTGKYAYRLIVPVYGPTGELETWTARAIDPKAHIRYLTLSSDEARSPPGNLLLGLPALYKAPLSRCLVICEGPFDAIAISTLGHSVGVWGTCIFGLELSDKQADLLSDLEPRFDKIRLILDPEQSWSRSLGMKSALPKRCKVSALPTGCNDPAELLTNKAGEVFVASLAL